MAADRARQPPGDERRRVATPQVRLRWLVAIVAVIAVLTAGWPLLDALVTDSQPLAGGTSLILGPGGQARARITIAPGWRLRPAESNLHEGIVLRSGPVQMSISAVSLIGPAAGPRMWAGLREILQLSHPGARIGSLTPITDAQDRIGFTGPVTSGRLVGTATIFIAPTGEFAIEMLVLAPPADRAEIAAVTDLFVRSLEFLSIEPAAGLR